MQKFSRLNIIEVSLRELEFLEELTEGCLDKIEGTEMLKKGFFIARSFFRILIHQVVINSVNKYRDNES